MPTDADGNKNCSNMLDCKDCSYSSNCKYCSNCSNCSGLSHASNVHGVHKDDDPPAYSSGSDEGRGGEGDGKEYLREQGGK
ncbi:hypothetical protein B0A54_06481 [Friedmanniomyces endolithicus]|uniref:Uncharacterized protein n=1 Tax=Friedmanniomyces endolithicus TaxID=329885 RepID=A0A4U0UZY0_9PEZI|nr:hypothetical protein B0A54_06481 [Friedmanniomyces endolithicus]